MHAQCACVDGIRLRLRNYTLDTYTRATHTHTSIYDGVPHTQTRTHVVAGAGAPSSHGTCIGKHLAFVAE